jgi:hypothetical protein
MLNKVYDKNARSDFIIWFELGHLWTIQIYNNPKNKINFIILYYLALMILDLINLTLPFSFLALNQWEINQFILLLYYSFCYGFWFYSSFIRKIGT